MTRYTEEHIQRRGHTHRGTCTRDYTQGKTYRRGYKEKRDTYMEEYIHGENIYTGGTYIRRNTYAEEYKHGETYTQCRGDKHTEKHTQMDIHTGGTYLHTEGHILRDIHMEGHTYGETHTRRDINTGETYTRGRHTNTEGHTHGGRDTHIRRDTCGRR